MPGSETKKARDRERMKRIRAAERWAEIDSAPKDGRWVMLRGGDLSHRWDGETEPPVVIAQYVEDRYADFGGDWHFAWYDGGYYGIYDNPCEWMSIPS